MKRLILALAVFLAAFTVNAQVKAVGISLGGSESLTMQHYIYGQLNSFFQLDLGYQPGVPSSGTLRLAATYNVIFWSPGWTADGQWNMYAGPGLQIGSGFTHLKPFNIGIAAQVGLEYLFDFPLQVSVDLRPSFGLMVSGNDFKFDVDGMLGFIPVVSARYLF